MAELFGVSRQTVWKWCKRARHGGSESFRDRPRRPKKRKIAEEVVFSIVELRTKFGWGTWRISQALFGLPEHFTGGQKSLAGRAIYHELKPLSFGEFLLLCGLKRIGSAFIRTCWRGSSTNS